MLMTEPTPLKFSNFRVTSSLWPISVLPQSKKAIEAQIQALSVHVTTIQTELTQCSAAISRDQKHSPASQQDLLRQLTAALLPLKQAFGIAGASSTVAQVPAYAALLAEQERNKRARSMDTASSPASAHAAAYAAAATAAAAAATAERSMAAAAATAAAAAGERAIAAAATARANAAAAATAAAAEAAAAAARASAAAAATRATAAAAAAAAASPRVILVPHQDIRSVLAQMAENPVPAIYDFQGRQVHSAGRRDINIVSDGVTLRNATFILPGPKLHRGLGGSSLVVTGRDVKFEDVSIIGGQSGVSIKGRGSLTMRHCRVLEANYGVHVEGQGWLVAQDLQVRDSLSSAFHLSDDASVDVVDCDVSGSGYDGIEALGSSIMTGVRMKVTGCEREVLRLFGSARLTLKDSQLSSYPGQPGCVNDTASLVMSRCDADGECERSCSASIHVGRY